MGSQYGSCFVFLDSPSLIHHGQGSGHSRAFTILIVMLKRRTAAPRVARKRRRGKTTYAVGTLDPPDDKTVVEDIRVWDVSTSERTGRVSASRRTVKHCHEAPGQLEQRSTSKENEGGKDFNVEGAGATADSTPSPETVKMRQKQKHVAGTKENDSVSEVNRFCTCTYSGFQTRMGQWLLYRPIVLDELLRLDGLGDALNTPGLCPGCTNAPAQLRCKDCFGEIMYCSACILSSHWNLPLHRLQVCETSHTVLTCVNVTTAMERLFL